MPWRWAVRRAAPSADRLGRGGSRSYLAVVNQSAITLTQSAARRVSAIAERQTKPAILRLSVDGGGCAGFTYRFELADALEDGDVVTETDGVRLIVDAVSLDLVRGSAVDYVEDLGGASFRVTNPNAASGCGCGSSFSV